MFQIFGRKTFFAQYCMLYYNRITASNHEPADYWNHKTTLRLVDLRWYLKRVVQTVHRGGVHGADNLQHAIEVVELLEDLQDLDDASHHRHPLLQVVCLHYAPREEGQESKVRKNNEQIFHIFQCLLYQIQLQFICSVHLRHYLTLILAMMRLNC